MAPRAFGSYFVTPFGLWHGFFQPADMPVPEYAIGAMAPIPTGAAIDA